MAGTPTGCWGSKRRHEPWQPAAVFAACALAAGFLLLGLVLVLRRWAVPASVAGGLLGFTSIQLVLRLGPEPVAGAAASVFEGLGLAGPAARGGLLREAYPAAPGRPSEPGLTLRGRSRFRACSSG